MSRKIFISHAVKDKPIVDAFVDLLQTGANIPYDEIFCSSLEGLGIPAGENFIDYIKDEIQTPELVIAIISENYLVSQFCMCELGASWAMSHNMLPLLVPPLEYSDVQGVLKSTQLTRLNDDVGLSQFATNVDEVFTEIKINIPRWNSKQKSFLRKLPKLIEGVSAPEIVSQQEYQSTVSELNDTKVALDEVVAENDDLLAKIEKLKACKDADDVKLVERDFSSEDDQLDALTNEVSRYLGVLNRAVSFVAFREISSGDETYLDYYKDPDTYELANNSVDNEYLISNDNRYSLNHHHPKIKKLSKSIQKLIDFIENKASSTLHEYYENEHEILLSISNREFWEFALDSNLTRVYA